MTETRTRSLLKTIVWPVLATVITLGVAYWFTGSIRESSLITFTAAALSMIAYYLHERAWNKISWGHK